MAAIIAIRTSRLGTLCAVSAFFAQVTPAVGAEVDASQAQEILAASGVECGLIVHPVAPALSRRLEWRAVDVSHQLLVRARRAVAVTSFEAVVENGQIRLPPNVHLPDSARVYVVVPEVQWKPLTQMASPRLVDPRQAEDFRMEVVPESHDAGL